MHKEYIPFDWKAVEDKSSWLDPCEESYYYAEKWKREGRKSILDLGCGLGRHSVLFAKYGFKVTAVDISEEALAHLKKLSKELGTEICCRRADMEALPFADDAFDCIFAMHSAGHADSKGMDLVMSEIKRTLKPDGTVFMTLNSKETWTYAESGLPKVDDNTVIKTDGPEQGVPHYFVDKEDIKRLFSDFELIKVRHIDDCYGD
ncbi:MAG: methyltransferase domain-containing protein, partial [Lachnospiraceae bacterium]|nr:methyltransferase domain-containing protein [Lachnospiraceae bacterium]